MKNILPIVLIVFLSGHVVIGQTLYVPSGTSGISSSSNGNVGVGTSTPQSKLEVAGGKITVSYSGGDHTSGNSIPMIGSTYPTLTDFGSGLNTLIENAANNQYGLQFVTRESWQIPSSAKMTVLGGGNVGIGTASPQVKFEVRGPSFRLSDEDTRYLEISQDAAGTPFSRSYSNGYAGAREFKLTGWSHLPDNSGSAKKDIVHFDGYNLNLLKDNGGNVGIGTSAPSDKLSVIGNISIPLQNSFGFGQTDRFTYDSKSIGSYSLGWYNDSENIGAPTSYFSAFGGIKFFTGGQSRLTIVSNGNVGIGTTTPDAKLTVKGVIHTQELNIDLNGAMTPDYVFEKTYDLKPIDEVETYINANKHLPEIPSAKEMEAKGTDVKALNLLLLKKVEELTLYMIEMKKENEKQNQVIEKLLNEKNPK